MNRRALFGLVLTPAALAATAATAGAGASAAPANRYVDLQTLTATAMRRDGRRGVMSVELGVDAGDAAVATRVGQSIPRLRAALNTVVQRSAAATLPGHPPDIERLGRELQTAADQALGRSGARVLMGTILVS